MNNNELCCSRKYPYPSHGRFLSLNPPSLRKFHFSVILSFKNWAFETPLPLGIFVNFPWGGHGYFLELYILGLHVTSSFSKIQNYRPTSVGRYVDRHSTDVPVDISAECWPICRSTYRSSVGWYVDWDVSVNVLTDVSTETSAERWSTYQPAIGRYLGRYSGWHSADTLTIDCRRNIGWLSVVYQSKA